MLAASKKFHVVPDERLNRPIPENVEVPRWPWWMEVELDGLRVAIDTWDTDDPGAFIWRTHPEIYSRINVLLKIQYRPHPVWTDVRKKGVRVYPWTVFPSREWTLECFDYTDAEEKHLGVISGSPRHGRDDFFQEAKKLGGFCCLPLTRGKERPPFDQYVKHQKASRWGISLIGKRGTDGKNRREIELASCGMPLALNYIPHYPFPFEPGVHFLYMPDASHLSRLKEVDPGPFCLKSREIYDQFWSVNGMSEMFVKLVISGT